jgi:TRAP transporter TAXI family solute receptor
MLRLLAFLSLLLTTTLLFAIPPPSPKPYEVIIGSGSSSGLYYPVAEEICLLINKETKTLNLHCTTHPSNGSVDNLELLRQGRINFGIAQSDLQYYAYKGLDDFTSAGPFSSLRAVISLHGEPFTVIVKEDSGIKSIDDIKRKRVNIGNLGSGQRATMERVMKALHWQKSDFSAITDLDLQEQATALCDDKIDAFIYTVGHPDSIIKTMALNCPIRIVPVNNPDIKLLTAANPFYVPMLIPGDIYKGNRLPITTFGVKATLLTTDKTPDWVVYNVNKAIFDFSHFNQFKHANAALIHLDWKSMLTGNSAPYADGALKFFKEKAWILDVEGKMKQDFG